MKLIRTLLNRTHRGDRCVWNHMSLASRTQHRNGSTQQLTRRMYCTQYNNTPLRRVRCLTNDVLKFQSAAQKFKLDHSVGTPLFILHKQTEINIATCWRGKDRY